MSYVYCAGAGILIGGIMGLLDGPLWLRLMLAVAVSTMVSALIVA